MRPKQSFKCSSGVESTCSIRLHRKADDEPANRHRKATASTNLEMPQRVKFTCSIPLHPRFDIGQANDRVKSLTWLGYVEIRLREISKTMKRAPASLYLNRSSIKKISKRSPFESTSLHLRVSYHHAMSEASSSGSAARDLINMGGVRITVK